MRTDPLIGRDVRVQYRTAALAWLCLLTAGVALLLGVLPTLPVTRWFGHAVATSLHAWPWLRDAGIHQAVTFTISGALLLVTAVAMRQAGRHCPSHPDLARRARRLRRWNRWMLRVSAAFWIFGMFVAYAAMPIRAALSG